MMSSRVIKIDRLDACDEAIRQAVAVLRGGGLVAFPTETVYGLGARADLPDAIARLRSVKERDAQKAFTVHISHRDEARQYANSFPGLAERFARKGWPGPLTLILDVPEPASTPIAVGRNGLVIGTVFHENTVGLRCPDDLVAQRILKDAGGPVVATSANLAGQPPPMSGEEALRGLGEGFDLLIDAGGTKYARASTIVRMTKNGYELVREGVLDAGIIERLSVLRVLFVCTGNTCRSPMAAAMAKHMLAERLGCDVESLDRRGVVVSSAGTSGGFGGASTGAQEAMAKRGVDLSKHASSALTADMVRQADHVYAMTRVHRDAIISLVPAAADRVQTLLEDQDVHDPMGGSAEEYERCAQTIEGGLKSRLHEVAI